MASPANSTIGDPNWGKPQLASHTWMEPLAVVLIMCASMYFNRKHNFSIIPPSWRRGYQPAGILEDSPSASPRDSIDDDIRSPYLSDNDSDTLLDASYTTTTTSPKHLPKDRSCCGVWIHTPNSSRFANHLHSRLIQKFPFLVEMFYWIINFAFYAISRKLCQVIFDAGNVWNVAEQHAIGILELEHGERSWLAWAFPLKEVDLQRWFMNEHTGGLTFLNRAYSLFHIPGTVAFLSWYYFAAPSFDHFSLVRRTMTLSNFTAFIIFTLCPVMPPRLLPEEFGFADTVHRDNAESVWQRGSFVNSLGAMPSLHFAYAGSVGFVVLWHGLVTCTHRYPPSASGGAWKATLKTVLRKLPYVIIGVFYPLMVLTAIITTANHFWLDVCAAVLVVAFAFMANTVWLYLLPLEDILLWILRLEKPVPTTGQHWRWKQRVAEDALKQTPSSDVERQT